MLRQLRRSGARAAAVLVGAALTLFTVPSPAFAAEGSIDHVETRSDSIRVLYSIPGIGTSVDPDLDSLTVTIDGEPVGAEAQLAADANGTIRRTAMLVIDVSQSMAGQRFEEAKLAARAFLETAPIDIFVGIVTFSGDVQVAQTPTLDRAALDRVVDDLALSPGAGLYDGVAEAVRTAGVEGQRSVLVLSDGRDTSGTALDEVTKIISESKVKVDVVALAQSDAAKALLRQMASAGGGAVLDADDPEALTEVFASEAKALARQILITAEVPDDQSALEASLEVSVLAAGETYTDSAYVTVKQQAAEKETAGSADPTRPALEGGLTVSRTTMLLGLAATGTGVLLVLLLALGVLSPRKQASVEDRISAYSRSGRGTTPSPAGSRALPKTSDLGPGMKSSALGVAQKALTGNRNLESALGSRLEGAGMSLKPAEWLLMHAGIAFGAGLIGMLLGSVFLALGLFGLGIVLPYFYLGMKRGRRIKAFGEQLPDTLQLMASSLSAGLSLAQSADTVVREGADPMSSEFKRALIEARLGVNIEDGLESIADRMQSEDFRWVVMAVRIQRDVGGNLSEVLSQVAATIRERAYLRRQVKTLSAEGRFSAWILGALPIAILAFLLFTRPGYLSPMLDSMIGWMMIGAGCVMMAIGAFWLSKLVKIEV